MNNMILENKPGYFSQDTALAMEAALAAGKRILELYNSGEVVKEGEATTTADLASQRIIFSMLKQSNLPALSEEQEDDLARLEAERIWIVDPLDGTLDFVNRTGEFSVMLALVQNGTPIAGVIYEPTTGVLFAAEKGRGSYSRINGGTWQKLQIREIDDLGRVRAVMSRHHFSDSEKDFLTALGIQNFVQMGSAGLKAAAIAEGKADLYFTLTDKIKQWDTAAANLIVSEAGGKITDMLGNELVYNTPDVHHQNGVLICNKAIHTEIIKRFAQR